MDNNSWRARGPSALRNEGGMLSRPAAPLPFILFMADCSSSIRVGGQLLSSTDGAWRHFLNRRLISRSDRDMLSLLTLAWRLMNMLDLDLGSVIVRPLSNIASLGEFASGVPLRS